MSGDIGVGGKPTKSCFPMATRPLFKRCIRGKVAFKQRTCSHLRQRPHCHASHCFKYAFVRGNKNKEAWLRPGEKKTKNKTKTQKKKKGWVCVAAMVGRGQAGAQ